MTQKTLESVKDFGESWSKKNAADVDSPNRTRTVTPVKQRRGPKLHLKKGSACWKPEKEPDVDGLLKGNGIAFATEDQVWYA